MAAFTSGNGASQQHSSDKKVMFCPYCGTKLDDGARFCKNCGEAVSDTAEQIPKAQQTEAPDGNPSERKTVYEGYIHKCPNCGEVLDSFAVNCPTCGYELRGARASSAVKEFSLKLEAIESRREYEKPLGPFAVLDAQQRVSKTDKQKISLIKSFSVPNTKEDMLEFMILATSSMNMRIYDSTNTSVSKSEKEINAAWFSKVQQVYEKAKRSYSTDSVFTEIAALYDSCNDGIRKSKKKGIIKWILMLGWVPIVWIVIIASLLITGPKEETKEIERLDSIVLDVQRALESGEYAHALRIADSIDYQRYDIEMERKWDIEREYWVNKVLEEAAANGVNLDYTPTPDVDNANDEPSNSKDTSGGIIRGFKEGMQPGLEAAKGNIDEFNQILNGEESGDSDAKE